MGGYLYSGIKEDMHIEQFSEFKVEVEYKEAQMREYYTDNPIDDYNREITFPNIIYSALSFYYKHSAKTREKVNSCIYLVCDGIDISAHKRTSSFLSYASAIERMVCLEENDNEIIFECNSC